MYLMINLPQAWQTYCENRVEEGLILKTEALSLYHNL